MISFQGSPYNWAVLNKGSMPFHQKRKLSQTK